MKNFFTWFMAFPSIVCLILLGCYRFQLAGQAEWITLITSWIGSTAAIMLGVVVYYQAEHHKASADKYAQESEKQAQVYREEEQKRRKQDLIIKANPIVHLKGLSRFDFNKNTAIGVLKSSSGNNLMEHEPPTEYSTFSNYFSCDIVFKNDLGRMIDFITVKSARLSCNKGAFTDENYEQHFSKMLFNYSDKPAIVRLGTSGEYIALVQLYQNDLNEEEISFWLQDETLNWILTFKYTLSNSCGVSVDFESQIIFNIKPTPKEIPIALICEPDVKQIVTWQRSEITVLEGE